MDFVVHSSGTLSCKETIMRCALGRGGIRADKREGDGATPTGKFALRRVFYRPDRELPPVTGLEAQPLNPTMGWCDDPAHDDYNRLVQLPHPASCERMWRDDALYDVLAVLGHNDDPPVPGLGSAIFLHPAETRLWADRGLRGPEPNRSVDASTLSQTGRLSGRKLINIVITIGC